MSKILSVIKDRRSVFPAMYIDKAIAVSDIETIIEAARWAPNHKKTEPWKFIVFHREEAKQNLANFLSQRFEEQYLGEKYNPIKHKKVRKKIDQSGCIIAIILDLNPESGLPEWEEVAALSCAVQNMWLQATDLGIGAYWSSPKTITTNSEDFLRLEENQKCLGLFYMGHWNKIDLPAKRKSIQEISEWR